MVQLIRQDFYAKKGPRVETRGPSDEGPEEPYVT